MGPSRTFAERSSEQSTLESPRPGPSNGLEIWELHAYGGHEHGRQKLLDGPDHGIRQQHTCHQGIPEKQRVRWPPTA